MDKKVTLGLRLPTDPRWADLTQHSLEDILTDHAYCEQKAATYCISLIQQYPEKIELVRELAPVVTEEWGHFRLVLRELEKRGLTLGHQRKDEYVNALLQFQNKGGSREDRLIEKLLTCALIEARSCERFRALSNYLDEDELRDFYYQFMVAEAGHYKMFLELAIKYGQEHEVRQRWDEYIKHEAEIMKDLKLRGDRIH